MKNLTTKKSLRNTLSQNLKLTSNTSFYKGIIVVLLISLLSFLTSCQKDYGDVITNELNLAQFKSISNSGSANISIEYGPVQKVEVTGNVDILKRVKAEVKNYNLDLDLKDGIYHDYELSYKITIPKVEKVSIKGSGNVDLSSFSQTENVTLEIDGSGGITFYEFPNIERLDVSIDGSGTIVAQSNIDSLQKLHLDISGSGTYSGFLVKSKDCNIDISGSGSANIYAIEDLDVNISGSGSVDYKGFPVIVSNITGSGSISNKN